MAENVHDRDVLIMATVPRFTPPTDRGMFLTPPAAIFKVGANGAAAPASFRFQATLLNMSGAVAFGFSEGLTPEVTGNEVVLEYSDMTAVSGTITATITVDGVLYTQVATVTKVADGASGSTTYTWVKYADTAAGAGLSDDPTGKVYIGLAYNKSTPTESTTPGDYAWSLMKGDKGAQGDKGNDGIQYYTWIKYADVADGTGMYDTPTDATLYIGLAVNKTSATKSTNKGDYVWSRFRGGQGVQGDRGLQGVRGNVDISAVTTSSVWVDAQAVAALAAAGYGAPQVRDMVNLYRADRTFSVQKMYNGSAWIAVDYVWNGNVFVKGSILPEAIDTRGLAVRDLEGNVILGSGTALPAAYAAPGTLNSDLAPVIQSAQAAADRAATTSFTAEPQLTWNFNGDFLGWSTEGVGTGNLQVGAGATMSIISTGTDPIVYSPMFSFNGATYDKVRMRVRRTGGTKWDGTIYYWVNGGHGETPDFCISIPDTTSTGEWVTLEWDMSKTLYADWSNSFISRLRVDLGAAAGDVFDVRWIAIGKRGPSPSTEAVVVAGTTAQWPKIDGAGKPQDNATVGATIGQDLFGQMTADNISTYIAAAAIKLALIDRASIGSLEALSAIIGTLQTSTSGQRSQLSDNGLVIFNTANIPVIQMVAG